MAWKCSLIPKGHKCPYEQFETLGCVKLNLSAAVQDLKWSLPIIGKTYKTYESKIDCKEWRKQE